MVIRSEKAEIHSGEMRRLTHQGNGWSYLSIISLLCFKSTKIRMSDMTYSVTSPAKVTHDIFKRAQLTPDGSSFISNLLTCMK